MAGGTLEQQRRAALAQHAVAESGHFQPRRNLGCDASQFSEPFKLGDEIAQVGVVH
jgi:hypothetical protein